MKRDIFIDTNIASNFANPADPNYKELIAWLNDNHDIAEGQEDDRAYLVVSTKLLEEYCRSFRGSFLTNAMPMIVNRLTIDGRLVNISNAEIREFKNAEFVPRIVRHMQSNAEDREHIPVVLLSERKYALTNDGGFTHDLGLFPRYGATVSDRPEQIPYKEG